MGKSRSLSLRKKYRSRPSPPYPANDKKWRGKIMKGNDGQTYYSKEASNGIYRWVLYSRKQPALRPVRKRKSRPLREQSTSGRPSRKRSTSRPLRKRSKSRRKSFRNHTIINIHFWLDYHRDYDVDDDDDDEPIKRKTLEKILSAHLKKFKRDIMSYANTVSQEYVADTIYGAKEGEELEPFDLVKPKVKGNVVSFTSSRHLTRKEIKVFGESFITNSYDSFFGSAAGYVDAKVGKGSLYLSIEKVT